MTRQVEAGKAVVRVEANRSKLAAGLAAAQKQLATFAKTAAKIGAGAMAGAGAVLTPLAGAAKLFADAGGALDDMSQRTGASVEALSALGYAAKMSGSTIEDIEKGIRTMQKGLVAGDASFAALGLSIESLRSMSPDEQFKAIADRLASIDDPAERASKAMEIFGKSGADLVPLLSGGARGIEALTNEAARNGAVMSGEQAEAAAKLGDAIDLVGVSFGGLVNTMGAQVAPLFTTLLQIVTSSINMAREWIAANQDTAIAVTTGAVALGAMGGAFVAASGAAIGLSAIIGVLGSVASVAMTVIGSLVSVVGVLTTAFVASTKAIAMFSVTKTALIGVMKAFRVTAIASAAATAALTAVTTAYSAISGGVASIVAVVSSAMAALRAITFTGALATLASGAASLIAAAAQGAYSLACAVATGATTALSGAATILQAILTFGIAVAIAAVVAALVGLAAYLIYASGAGGKALAWLGDKFKMLQEIAGPVFKGIQDAMAGGNLGLAAEIAWNGIQLAWIKGTADLRAGWDTWLNGLLGALDGFVTSFRKKWNDAIGWVADRMLDTMGAIDSSFDAESAKQMRASDTARQNKSFDSGAASRAAERDAASKANIDKREAAIKELEGKLAASVAKAAESAVSTAEEAKSQSLVIDELEEKTAGVEEVTSNSVSSGTGRETGTFSGFAAAMLGQGGRSVDLDILAESKTQSTLLGKMLTELQNQKGAAFA